MSSTDKATAKPHGVLPAKQARSQRRQRAILDAAKHLLETVGYEHMKMEDIASTAESSVGTLYQRFKNKEGLLDALLKETLLELEEIVQRDLTPEKLHPGGRHAIRALVRIVVDFFAANKGFTRALTSRQLRDPAGVTPLQAVAREGVVHTWQAVQANADAPFDDAARDRFLFGFQIVIGTATNAILNRPGPLLIDDTRLIDALTDTVERLLHAEDMPL